MLKALSLKQKAFVGIAALATVSSTYKTGGFLLGFASALLVVTLISITIDVVRIKRAS